ncbi:hypothetical protein [Ghiorsea bivora]|uniref:hypothetical protein n=1 Tax=Ghiorsea bivora TaxID=1485545 RepID=UPI000571C86C|nr:hypothetical protein [Ghiorsea bivora]
MWHRTPIEEAAALMQRITQHHGRSMLIGGAALFLYGKPQRSLDYDLWVRIANDELVEILTAHGFEIDSNRAGRMVAYYEECKFDFFLFKRAYNYDKELVEYDAIEANAKEVCLEHGKLLIPSIEDMIKLKKLGDDIRSKDLEDIAYLEALLKAGI